MKKKRVIIGIIVLVILGILGILAIYSRINSKAVTSESDKATDNIYLFNKTKSDGITDISVFKGNKIINLGQTTLGFVKYIPSSEKYLLAESNKEDTLKSNLLVVNKDESKVQVASVVTNMISKIEIMNDYLFYKDSENGHYTALNLSEVRMDKQVALENASKMVSSYGEYAYFLNSNNDLYSYNFTTNVEKEIIKNCETENAYGDNIVITLADGSLYYYDVKTNELTKDEYKISDNVKIKDNMHPITLVKSFENNKLVYTVPQPRQTGVYDLYLKVKNEKPIRIAEDINQVKIFGNDCFVNTLITAENKKFTGEVKYINLDKPSEARVISNIYLSVDKMEKAEDGTYYMSYSDIVDDTPEMNSQRGGLFKYKAGEEKAVSVANSVIDFAVEKNNIVYATVNSLTDWNEKYDIYINDKKVASEVKFASIKGSLPVFEGQDGYLYLIKEGQVQKIDVKVQDYNTIINN